LGRETTGSRIFRIFDVNFFEKDEIKLDEQLTVVFTPQPIDWHKPLNQGDKTSPTAFAVKSDGNE
jgi:hypothetical protein